VPPNGATAKQLQLPFTLPYIYPVIKKHNYAVMLAGGIGSRFWPLSKSKLPKQFLDILGVGKSLMQMTYERLQRSFHSDKIFVITNESYAEIAKKQLPQVKEENFLLEPARKNTAPCIAYAGHKILSLDSNSSLGDHSF
jgi:mannose-1-phosphate guanylyltransferase